ncbi:DUF2955 domain-containing protein [Aeromonas sp. FDAARGOS 1407]|uniref:DUF2955 domain-containing protein n=1 Tax=Aeromonas TaxID=642 RepID=UPI001C2416D6|nr:DUF2955 domain-containing protein [Aeromonas sp. FDAARGOS 1407]QXC34439.1 DUF2955 domain-containing protein [Aeromonas sp. FDAARGOS 1407]
MHRADKAILRLTLGMGLCILITYGLALPLPHLSSLVVIMLLCKPGPPLSTMKGLMIGGALMVLMGTGVLMVPLLQHYGTSAMLLIALLLFGLFYLGLKNGNPLLLLLVATLTLIPVAGTASQALAFVVIQALAIGIILGAFISSVSHNLFPDEGAPLPKPEHLSPDNAGWVALRAVIIVLPVLVMALQDPAHYLAAIMKTVALSQQACTTQARNAGKELVGSTLMGALIAALAWFGLALLPSLWMLMLWVMLICLWLGRRLFRIVPSRLPASFWSNALMTVIILLGPAIQDSANGKDVMQASLFRLALFILVSCYAWGAIWVLERWRAGRRNGIAMIPREPHP